MPLRHQACKYPGVARPSDSELGTMPAARSRWSGPVACRAWNIGPLNERGAPQLHEEADYCAGKVALWPDLGEIVADDSRPALSSCACLDRCAHTRPAATCHELRGLRPIGKSGPLPRQPRPVIVRSVRAVDRAVLRRDMVRCSA